MKHLIQKFAVATALCAFAASAQDTIVYVNGPSFPIPTVYDNNPAFIDLNNDGTPDFSCVLGYFVCTADVPTSGCSAQFYFTAEGTNSLLHQYSQATMLGLGDTVSSVTSSNAAWNNPDPSTWVASYGFSPRYGTRGYSGPLAKVGAGYLGVRFFAADGLHYGWIRLHMPTGADFPPVVVDWAYETRINTAIRAGVIGSRSDARQFAVNFSGGSTGSLILSGKTVRAELNLAGDFTSATLAGPAAPHAPAKPVADFGSPLDTTTNYTSFFRDVTLSQGDVVQLLRGADYVSVSQGQLVGSIVPLK